MRTTVCTLTHLFALAVMIILLTSGDVAARQEAGVASPDAARGLVSALERSSLGAIATADPESGGFVAALYIPGSQLLVVSAEHPSVDGIAYRLAMGEYREVYLDLQGTPTSQNKFFVQDAGADGIRRAPRGSGDVDILYEDGVHQTLFNGDPKGQNLTSDQYDARLAAADARYTRLLSLLTSAVDE